MTALIWPNAENCSQSELEVAMNASPTQHGFVRMKAIHTMMRGFDHTTVAGVFDITRPTLNQWIKRFNERGVDGLIDVPRSGRPPIIKPEQTAKYRQLIEHPEQVGQVHWTAKKFHGYLCEEVGHEVGYSTLLRWLHEQNFRLKVPQPWPDRQDEDARIAFVDRVNAWLEDDQVELWYQDEMGVEGDPRPRRRWIQKGQKGRVTRNGDHLRMNVCGMVCPRTGEFFALETTHSDGDTFQVFLREANGSLHLKRKRQLLIMDNASWHKRKTMDWGRFEPVYLPAYSPDLNPIERLWLLVKGQWFADFVAKEHQQLMARLDQALLWVIDRKHDNQQTCRIKRKL
jgi:transposase